MRKKGAGITSRIENKKPWIRQDIGLRCLEFCRQLVNLPQDTFRSWLFCDEARITLWHNDMDRIYVKRRSSEYSQEVALRGS